MKKVFLILLTVFITIPFLFSQTNEKAAIRQVIQEAYVDGIQNRGDIEIIRKGFDPGFELLGVKENKLTKLSIGEWIANIEKTKQNNPNPPVHLTSVKFLMIDITGISAVAKIELYRQGKRIFTDYLSLYKFDEGWKVVNKIYHRH